MKYSYPSTLIVGNCLKCKCRGMGDFRVWKMYAVLSLFASAVGTRLGVCPIYPQIPNFDMHRMAGTWYEVERSFYLMEISASCTELRVAVNERAHYLITINTISRWTGTPSTTYGLGIPSHNGSSSFRYKLNNRMPYLLGRLLPGAGQYAVLDTDYTQYAVVWSCSSVSIAHSDRMWVLGRRRELGAALRARIYARLARLQLDPDRLLLSRNTNCTQPANILN